LSPTDSGVLKKFALSPSPAAAALAASMGSSSTSSGFIPVLRCPVLFDGINYHDWVPRMRLHVRVLQL
jgi:hypothetical protein